MAQEPANKSSLVDKLHLQWAVAGFTKRNIKTLIRCLVVLLGTLVLILDQAALQTMGQAAFFASVVHPPFPPLFPCSSLTDLFFLYSSPT